jgi:methanogenic corrinoid protein MtbC1
VSLEFADEMGADGYGENAMACVELAKSLAGVTEEEEAEVGSD